MQKVRYLWRAYTISSNQVGRMLASGGCIKHQSMLSCLAQLLPLTCNGTLDEKVGDQARMGQQGLGDRGGGVVLQPVLHGGPLVCVPVCSYHRLHHHCLQSRKLVSKAAVPTELITITALPVRPSKW